MKAEISWFGGISAGFHGTQPKLAYAAADPLSKYLQLQLMKHSKF